jgi:CRISPR/Cas system-associated exonuclease Cas4 (RecB family)
MDKSVIRKGSRIGTRGLAKFIMNGLKSREKRTMRNRLYCGDAAYCPRKATLFATTTGENTSNAAGQFYMETGTTVHRLIQKAFERTGILVEAERRINIEYDGIALRGMVDAIVEVDGEQKVVEIKTCGELPGKPKKEHLHQALTYALVTGVHKVVIFYMSRKVASYDGHLICTEFEYDVTQAQLDMIAGILASSFVGAKSGVVPMIPDHITHQHDCGFCPFQTLCWGPEAKRFPPLKANVIKEVALAKEALLKDAKAAHKAASSGR